MSEDQRKIMWQTQTDELYQCIGEFVVKFERVTFSMSMGVIAMLSRSGLKDQQLAYVLLAGVTADPLRSLFESLSAQTAWLRAAERDQLKTLMARVQKLTKERNDIVHGTWLIDFHNYASHQQDFSTAFGMKYHKNKDGAATKSFERTKDDFAHLIQETDDLRSAIDKLCGRFIFDDYGNQVAFERPTDA